jgi:hypothetical protein
MPNITNTPSFIQATQFKSPKHLATYLVFLEANPSRYEEYRAWRKSPTPFSDEYLQTMQHRVVSPMEIAAHDGNTRQAACCRLCNPDYVKWAHETRKTMPHSIVYMKMTEQDITARYFQPHK